MYPNTVRIHSKLADGGHGIDSRGFNAIALWYWCRAIDTAGSGKVTFPLKQAAAAINKSVLTIKRYLKSGLGGLQLFRSVVTRDGVVTVYLASRDQVCLAQKLESWGATADVPVERLKDLRSIATEIAVAAMQKASVHLAMKGLKKRDRANVITPEVLTTCSSSLRVNVLHQGKRCLFVGENAILSGASQQGIGEYLGRATSTIKNRLSAAYRSRHELEAIFRKQLCQTKPEHAIDRIVGLMNFGAPARLFECAGKTFKSACNLYDVGGGHVLTSSRVAKGRYNRKKELAVQGTDKAND